MSAPWDEELLAIAQRNLTRSMPEVSGQSQRTVIVNGREALNFSSNNYLGLASHPRIISAMARSAALYGVGAGASRLITGNTQSHRTLETNIAEWKGAEAALVFGSGYQANVGILTSLTDRSDVILSDSLNHASIIDGCRLSRADIMVYNHLDVDHLAARLSESRHRRKLVVTESIFSMDGDAAPLGEISRVCREAGALLMVDEAHAGGVIGPAGRGLAAQMGIVPDIHMGTLGKAIGVSGAYVAGAAGLIRLLVNKARSFIYTTAQPPAVMDAASEALAIVRSPEGDERRKRLQGNTGRFADLLSGLPGVSARGGGHIVPVIIGDSAKTMRVSAALMERGVFAHGIRYPTVPEGSARLRFTLMSDHTTDDLDRAVSELAAALKSVT